MQFKKKWNCMLWSINGCPIFCGNIFFASTTDLVETEMTLFMFLSLAVRILCEFYPPLSPLPASFHFFLSCSHPFFSYFPSSQPLSLLSSFLSSLPSCPSCYPVTFLSFRFYSSSPCCLCFLEAEYLGFSLLTDLN